MPIVDSARTCTLVGCNAKLYSRGLCEKHYQAARYAGTLPPLVCLHPGCGATVIGRGRGYCKVHYTPVERPPCAVAGCGKKSRQREWCAAHYRAYWLYGDPLGRVRMCAPHGSVKGKPCCVAGCSSRGRITINDLIYCATHGQRMKKHGDPHTILRMENGKVTPERKKAQRAIVSRRYHQTPHGKMRLRFNKAKYRAMKHGCDWETGIPKEVFLELYARTQCAICGFYMPKGDRTLDHIVPLSGGGPNAPSNLQTVHMACNSRKGGVRPKTYKKRPRPAPAQ